MFDESLLDDVEVLARRDGGRLLWSLATAGAQVRRAVSVVDEFGLSRLADEPAPRALLVATDASGLRAARTLCRLAGAETAAVSWHGAELPRWAGPADALLVASLDGRHPRLVGLVEQAAHRGLVMAVVAPPDSPLAQAAGRSPVAELPEDLHPRAAVWSLTTPLLQAADALGVTGASPALLNEVADALDQTAESCRPQGDAFTNPAKSLAVELSESLAVIVGAGPLAAVAAHAFSESLQLLAGVPAIGLGLPDEMAVAGSLLRGAPQDVFDDDFFRDRAEAPVHRPRLITIGDEGDPDDPLLGPRSETQLYLDEAAARRSAAALHGIALQRGLRSSSVDVPHAPVLARFAAATAFGDFTATYLALGLAIDPSEPRPGELQQ